MEMTDLGFYMIGDEEYASLASPDPNTTYVLVNKNKDEFVVLRGTKYLGRIDVNNWNTEGLKQVEDLEKKFGFSSVGVNQNNIQFAGKNETNISMGRVTSLTEKIRREAIIQDQLKNHFGEVKSTTLGMSLNPVEAGKK